MIVTGQVYKVFTKVWPPNARNPKGNTSYSLKLEGNPLYYRAKGALVLEPGTFVSFDASPKDATSATINGDVTTVTATAPTAAAPSVVPSATPAGGGYDLRQNSIVYQSSRKDALVYVSAILAAGAVKLPEKAALKLAALDALLDAYTASFFNDVNTLGAIARVNGTEAPAADAPAVSEEE